MTIGYRTNNQDILIAESDITLNDIINIYTSLEKSKKLVMDNYKLTVSNISDFIKLGGQYLFIDYLFCWKQIKNGVIIDI